MSDLSVPISINIKICLGSREITMVIEAGVDYVFQVIAREEKGETHGIDYKYSDMVTSYVEDSLNVGVGTTTTTTSTTSTTTTTSRAFVTPQVRSAFQSLSYDHEVRKSVDFVVVFIASSSSYSMTTPCWRSKSSSMSLVWLTALFPMKTTMVRPA